MKQIPEWFAPLRGRIMVVFVLIIGLYFVVAFGEQAWRARELESEVASRQAEIAELVAKRNALQSQVNAYGTDRYHTYVEQTARRDLSLAYPGEKVLLVQWEAPAVASPVEEEDEVSSEEHTSNWQRWISLFTGSS